MRLRTGLIAGALLIVLCVAITFYVFNNLRQTPPINPQGPTVYYSEDALSVTVHHPRFDLRIEKGRNGNQAAGRISQLRYMNDSIINGVDPRFGTLSLLSSADTSDTQKTYPDSMFVARAVGNNSNKLVLTLIADRIVSVDELLSLPVNVSVEYTFYADVDNIYVWTTIDSAITSWRLSSATYGLSIGWQYFQKYEVRGTASTLIGDGSLTGTSSDSHYYSATGIQVTLKNVTNNLAATLYPLGLFPSSAYVRDQPGMTWTFFELAGARTFDDIWYNWGTNMRGVVYGLGIALHQADSQPQIIVPWLMPNAVPYGIMHSYDELPSDTYNRIQPEPDNSTEQGVRTYFFWKWHEDDPQARINLMLGLDMMEGDYGITPTPEGIDNSWQVHGTQRLANASTAWKNWLKTIEASWIDFGVHAYHHNYPWTQEFHAITNTSCLDQTWNQIILDIHVVGLKNQTWFKAGGYKARSQILDVLLDHGLKAFNVNYDEPPSAIPQYLYRDAQGRPLILFSNSLSPDMLFTGTGPEQLYCGEIKGNMTSMGLLSMSGHFFNGTVYPDWKQLFSLVENDFHPDYFLVEEIIDYWQTALVPLKYTYNSTLIEQNIMDPRLTFRLTNSSVSTTSGIVNDAGTFKLYCPNVDTPNFSLKRLSGYSLLTDSSLSTDGLSLTISSPVNSTLTVTVDVSQNTLVPRTVRIGNTILASPTASKDEFDSSTTDAWFYDSPPHVLYLRFQPQAANNIPITIQP
jgi:hypothetical protein